VNAKDSKAEIFDVFLCHNGEDKPAVREIAQKLAEKNIKPWLDEEEIRPGTSWQKAIGQQIENIKSAAIFVGESGLGPWQDQEIQALLSQFVKREYPVIPVVLPSAKTKPDLDAGKSSLGGFPRDQHDQIGSARATHLGNYRRKTQGTVPRFILTQFGEASGS
jgi:hypothetical protein